MTTEGGPASARCEALARLAIAAAGLIARRSSDASAAGTGGAPDGELLGLVERSAAQVKQLLPFLPGHAPWGAQADAALATIALERGDIEAAVMAGEAAFHALQAGLHEDVSLEIVLPAARAVFAGAAPEGQAPIRAFLRTTLTRIAHGTAERIDPGSMAHRADRTSARRAGWPDGRARPRRRGPSRVQ